VARVAAGDQPPNVEPAQEKPLAGFSCAGLYRRGLRHHSLFVGPPRPGYAVAIPDIGPVKIEEPLAVDD
jgi:hypothetical protein